MARTTGKTGGAGKRTKKEKKKASSKVLGGSKSKRLSAYDIAKLKKLQGAKPSSTVSKSESADWKQFMKRLSAYDIAKLKELQGAKPKSAKKAYPKKKGIGIKKFVAIKRTGPAGALRKKIKDK